MFCMFIEPTGTPIVVNNDMVVAVRPVDDKNGGGTVLITNVTTVGNRGVPELLCYIVEASIDEARDILNGVRGAERKPVPPVKTPKRIVGNIIND